MHISLGASIYTGIQRGRSCRRRNFPGGRRGFRWRYLSVFSSLSLLPYSSPLTLATMCVCVCSSFFLLVVFYLKFVSLTFPICRLSLGFIFAVCSFLIHRNASATVYFTFFLRVYTRKFSILQLCYIINIIFVS